jgi:glycosyltransferase involved in cell wall biosynthesis
MPSVSVIIPTYNRGWIIERAISSVLSQTYRDFELIIVDDGSRDDTLRRLSKLKDSRVRVFSKKNAGAAAARNFGIKKSRASLLAFLDSDNTWHQNFLEVMKSELKPSDNLAYSGQNLILVKGKNQKVLGRAVRNEEYNFTKLLSSNYIDTSSVLVRKSAVLKAGLFDAGLKTLEDWDLYGRIAIKNPLAIKYVNQVLGVYYYFLKGSVRTITNKNFPESGIKKLFGIHGSYPDRKKIQTRFQRLSKKLVR